MSMETAPARPATGSRAQAPGNARVRLSRVVLYAVLVLVTITTILPVLWMITTSLKTQAEFMREAWLWPREPTLDAYFGLFGKANFGRYFVNSLVVTLGNIAIVLLVGSMAAFALARYEFRGRSAVLTYFLLGQMVPATVIIVPLYLILSNLHLLNAYEGLVLAYSAGALPLTIFLLRGFFLGIPAEIEDAARIDGAGEFQLFWRIILPLGAPGLATAGIFEFLFTWNDFVLVLVIMQRNIMRTLTLAVFQAVGEYGTEVPSLFAGLTISAIPVVVAYLLFTRQFIQGITAGAIKG